MAYIILIDDDALQREVFAEALQQAGHDVDHTDTPERELVKADRRSDLILLDVQMPMMDGDDLARFFKEEWDVKVPIYLISSLGEEELSKRAEAAPVEGYLCKSWGVETMVSKVSEILT